MRLSDWFPVLWAVAVILGLLVAERRLRGRSWPGLLRPRAPAWVPPAPAAYDDLLRAVRNELARQVGGRVDWSRPIEDVRRDLGWAAEHLIDVACPLLNRIERDKLHREVVAGITGPPRAG